MKKTFEASQVTSSDDKTKTGKETCPHYKEISTMCALYPEAHISFDKETAEVTITPPSAEAFAEAEATFNSKYRKVGGHFVRLNPDPVSIGVVA